MGYARARTPEREAKEKIVEMMMAAEASSVSEFIWEDITLMAGEVGRQKKNIPVRKGMPVMLKIIKKKMPAAGSRISLKADAIVANQGGLVTFKYTESKTGEIRYRTLSGEDFCISSCCMLFPRDLEEPGISGFCMATQESCCFWFN